MHINLLAGVYVAAVTPLTPEFKPDLAALLPLLHFFARRGCHGALILGTTGEGPSFSPGERKAIYQAAIEIKKGYPNFHMLAGTGTPSLTETIEISQTAFHLGFDGVVVLPPYYFRNAPEEGLFTWFNQVIDEAVPDGGALLGYHFPAVSGVPLSINLLSRLHEAHPNKFAGLKDSSGDQDHARRLHAQFGTGLLLLSGNDQIYSQTLSDYVSGCITAPANLFSPELRLIWETRATGKAAEVAVARLQRGREILEQYRPFAPILKAVLAARYDFPYWPVRPPLVSTPPEVVDEALKDLNDAGLLMESPSIS